MTRAFLARALHALGTLVAGDDPAALAIAEAARARAEAERAVDLARLALTSAERAVGGDAVTMGIALTTQDVLGAMLREGIARAEAGFSPLEARHLPTTTPDAAGMALRAAGGSLPAVTVARSRELLRDLGCAEEEPPPGAGGDD